ncbi:iron-siderophore ABC transporter substrate-binding protein [Kocuria sp. LUK]|uniref:iron-siderophore ABC transporter substrate-binding protein n=1 Tax=Kocuria sp. LUK TaxID=2897828 RepID=UPI001E606492|nr:iron-siderophore ABC transporter substrate-binding protein [Kocuria sp. LUK]MCD1144688.1 iron-siderophore ABC transporter substrate-binding protein [Kocuria sp. LUK]
MASSPLRARRSPRAVPAVLLTAGALLLAGCSTGPAGGGSAGSSGSAAEGATGEFPRTVEHVYGETTIEEAPERVATVSWVNHDVATALGVVPVGVPTTDFGANEAGSTDWFDAALEESGAEAPQTYSETDGINFEAIAALDPDVILGAYSGLTREDYDKLSEIAPVVAYPEDAVAYGTSWQDSTELIGQALGREERAREIVEDVEQQIAETAEQYPELEGTSFVYGTLDPSAADPIIAYTEVDNRPKLLTSLGMVQAEAVTGAAEGKEDEFYVTWSPENADDLVSDVFVSWAAGEDVREDIESDPLLSSIPAVADDALVLQTDEQEVLSVSAASPLSIPWALENVVPDIAEAARTAGGE